MTETHRTGWWVGAYTADSGRTAEGIMVLDSREDGSLEYRGLAVATHSPSFLLERGDRLYATSEFSGRVEAFRRSGERELVSLGGVDSGGALPCHLGVYGSPEQIVVSCYGDGTLGVLGIDEDGALLSLRQRITAEGSGPLPQQQGPHAHSTIALDASTILSVDLGADRLTVWDFGTGELVRMSQLRVAPGSGPRHILRHPSGLFLLVTEHSNEVLVLEWRGGELSIVASARVPGAVDGDFSAEISLSVDGRFVYVGLRGSNTLGVLEVGENGRALNSVGFVSTEGDWPRHQAIDGDLLHVANQRSSTVSSFRLRDDGMPIAFGTPTSVPSPTYLLRRGNY